MRTGQKLQRIGVALGVVIMALAPGIARADEVANWNETLFRTALIGGTSPLNVSRVAAIVQSAVFDALNGIEQRYTYIRVPPAATGGASADAAVAQAAYATLVALYPTQRAALDARLAVSLAVIGTHESSAAIASGRAWGQTVADAILLWRSTDGFTPAPPPFLGGLAVGQWRPTPPGNLPGAGPQFAYMTPWVIQAPWQFRPAGPPALSSAQYVADFNETKIMGSLTSPARTADQTVYAWFWASASSNYLFNQVALDLFDRGRGWYRGWDEDDDNDDDDRRWHRRDSSLKRAHLLAQLNLAMADAAIGCWDAKYVYTFWRPVTAIPLADTDGNPDTASDPGWTPLFATPAHPEYPSGHSCISGAAGAILSARFGERTHFTVQSDAMIGVTRKFRSFGSALEEIKNARIFAGIHFRTATDHGQTIGHSVAEYVLEHAVQPLDSDH